MEPSEEYKPMNSKEFLKKKKLLIYDFGNHSEMASKLGEKFGEVMYYVQKHNVFPKMEKDIVGVGLPNLTVVDSFWDNVDSADAILFPTTMSGDMVEYLRSKKYPVMGNGTLQSMELDRAWMRKAQKKLGLLVQQTKVIQGIDNLRSYLKNENDKYVKISKYRGNGETFHHISSENSKFILDKMEYELGGMKNMMEFIVEDPIGSEGDVEVGIDGILVNGKLLSPLMYGYVTEDYFSAVKASEYNDLPHPLKDVSDKLEPLFKNFKTTSFFGNEIRMIDKDKWYLTDPCVRIGYPSSDVFSQEMIENLAEVIYGASHGVEVKPKFKYKYGAMVAIDAGETTDRWIHIDIPEKYKQFVKVFRGMKTDHGYEVSAKPQFLFEVIGFGNTLDEAIADVKKHSEGIKGNCFDINFNGFKDLKDEIAKGEKLGIQF